MALEDIVDLTITASTLTPSRPGFGTPLLAVGKVPVSWGTSRVRSFSKLTELTDAGFAVTDPAYGMASKAFSASPKPKKVKIGKRAVGASQSVQLLVTSAAEGLVYHLTVGTTLVTYTVLAAATTSTVATALAALINALPATAASAATATITVTPEVVGTLVNLSALNKELELTDNTADPGIAADLAAFQAEDSDWYGLALDSNSKNEVLAAAAWAEANKKIFGANSSDAGVAKSGSTTDVAYLLKAASYKFTYLVYSKHELLSYAGLAWMAEEFPFDPGGRTWAFKQLSGVTVDVLTGAEESAVQAKNSNTYTTVAGLPITFPGKTANGDFIDNRRFIDWLESEMKIQVFAKLATTPKIPYTDKGVSLIVAVMKAVLRAGVRAGGLADDENLQVQAPKVADVDTISRAGRLLPDLSFGARLSGAIHSTKIAGTLSV